MALGNRRLGFSTRAIEDKVVVSSINRAASILEPLGVKSDDLTAMLSVEGKKYIHESAKVALVSRIKYLDEKNSLRLPNRISKKSSAYERDTTLVGLLKELRGAKCQICGTTFKTQSDGYYCEAHHIEHLSKQGLDVSENILLLCPNHHSQLHHGNAKVSRLPDGTIAVTIDGDTFICEVSIDR